MWSCRAATRTREFHSAATTPAKSLASYVVNLDHVVIAVPDLLVAAREFRDNYGLVSLEGGRHPAWGTANRIMPLGDSYLELVSVVDEAKAIESVFGSWVARGASPHGRAIGWAVRLQNLDAVAKRLHLQVEGGSRTTATGDLVQWRTAGIAQAASDASLPFFIEWGPRTPLPGKAPITHPSGATGVARLILHSSPGRLAAWLGDHRIPIVVHAGEPALAGIVLSGSGGETVISFTPED